MKCPLRSFAILYLFFSTTCLATPMPKPLTARVFGQKIQYYDVGTGSTIVLVHGFGSSAIFDWDKVIGPLSKHHRVLAMDQVGWGKSDKPLTDYSIQTWVDFLGEFLRQLKIERFTLAGESLGGWIAAQYTIQTLTPDTKANAVLAYPRPEKLILSDAAGHANSPPLTPYDFDNSSIASLRESLSHVFFDKSLVTNESARQAFIGRLASGAGFTANSFLSNPTNRRYAIDGKLASITLPTLVVWGANDELVPLADGRDYAAQIPSAKLVIIPECGHVPAVEKPQQFLLAVAAFLGDD